MTMRAQIIQARFEFGLLVPDIECLLINPFGRFQKFERMSVSQQLQKIGDL